MIFRNTVITALVVIGCFLLGCGTPAGNIGSDSDQIMGESNQSLGNYGAIPYCPQENGFCIHRRSDWYPNCGPYKSCDKKPVCSLPAQTPNLVVIHHTEQYNADPTDAEAAKQQIRSVYNYHTTEKEKCDIAYHFLIDRAGDVWEGHDARLQGQHSYNVWNGAIGIAFLGTFTNVEISEAQISGAAHLLAWLRDAYGINLDRDHVKGHREVNQTSCPGNKLFSQLPSLVDTAHAIPASPLPLEQQRDCDLVEYNLDSWGSGFVHWTANPPADAILANQTSKVLGMESLSVDSMAPLDWWLVYPVKRDADWNISDVSEISFYLFGHNRNISGWQTDQFMQPKVVLEDIAGARLELTPKTNLIPQDLWGHVLVPLTDTITWSKTSAADLAHIRAIEIRANTSGTNGFTIQIDALTFITNKGTCLTRSALSQDSTCDWVEQNLDFWGTGATPWTGAQVDDTITVDESNRMAGGEQSLLVDTMAPLDWWLIYPASGDADWDLSDLASIFFFARGHNKSVYGWQGNQPQVALRDNQGSKMVFQPRATLLPQDQWVKLEIPVTRQDGSWTVDGNADMQHIQAIEIHADTWEANGFTFGIDGLVLTKTNGSCYPRPF